MSAYAYTFDGGPVPPWAEDQEREPIDVLYDDVCRLADKFCAAIDNGAGLALLQSRAGQVGARLTAWSQERHAFGPPAERPVR